MQETIQREMEEAREERRRQMRECGKCSGSRLHCTPRCPLVYSSLSPRVLLAVPLGTPRCPCPCHMIPHALDPVCRMPTRDGHQVEQGQVPFVWR
jgi:hypothetical protein